jgi:hypothetical protein
VRPADGQIVLDADERRAVRQAQRAPAVGERRPSEEDLDHLGDHPVADPQEPSHVGLFQISSRVVRVPHTISKSSA